mmetsp:Transcript_22745/g.73151  ORF Transcript_22745/g.73151 Transcript_22745/m.73151 type:complete len:253 (+) Transcript_22745:623-1381(+)
MEARNSFGSGHRRPRGGHLAGPGAPRARGENQGSRRLELRRRATRRLPRQDKAPRGRGASSSPPVLGEPVRVPPPVPEHKARGVLPGSRGDADRVGPPRQSAVGHTPRPPPLHHRAYAGLVRVRRRPSVEPRPRRRRHPQVVQARECQGEPRREGPPLAQRPRTRPHRPSRHRSPALPRPHRHLARHRPPPREIPPRAPHPLPLHLPLRPLRTQPRRLRHRQEDSLPTRRKSKEEGSDVIKKEGHARPTHAT